MSLSPSSPLDLLRTYQSKRLQQFSKVFDASRYHVQVLIVDDDSTRARTCESLLERVSIWADAGWWIWPSSASIGGVQEGSRSVLPSLRRSFDQLGLCRTRLEAASTQLAPSDLLGAYDVVLCIDMDVLGVVRTMARENGGDEAIVLSMTDFLAYGGDRMDCLDDDLRSLVALHYATVTSGSLIELPSAYPSNSGAWEQFLAASALTSAGLVGFLKDEIDNFFVCSFQELLNLHFPTAESCSICTTQEAVALLRKHQVTGGLDPKMREAMFKAHCAQLCEGVRKGGCAAEHATGSEDRREGGRNPNGGRSGELKMGPTVPVAPPPPVLRIDGDIL